MGASIGHEVPVWDSHDQFGDTALLVENMEMGRDLAKLIGSGGTALMRGHGATVAGRNIRHAVYVSVYLEVNARLQKQAMDDGARSNTCTPARSTRSPSAPAPTASTGPGRTGAAAPAARCRPSRDRTTSGCQSGPALASPPTERHRTSDIICRPPSVPPVGPVCYRAGGSEWADHAGEPCRARRMAAERAIDRHGCHDHDVGTGRRGRDDGCILQRHPGGRRHRQALRDAGRRAGRRSSAPRSRWRRASFWG